uniref:Uncharacterized protein n=1 Tax=Glossina pallidipes TaxID=7398 RepID=A0A1A9ZND2_GLOPL
MFVQTVYEELLLHCVVNHIYRYTPTTTVTLEMGIEYVSSSRTAEKLYCSRHHIVKIDYESERLFSSKSIVIKLNSFIGYGQVNLDYLASRIACRCDHNNHQIYSGFHKVEGDYELLNFER